MMGWTGVGFPFFFVKFGSVCFRRFDLGLEVGILKCFAFFTTATPNTY
jgi:hypothetical protein